TSTSAMRSLLLNASSTCRRSTLPYRVSSWAVLWRWVSHHGTLAAVPATASSITIRTTRLMGHLLPPSLPPLLRGRLGGQWGMHAEAVEHQVEVGAADGLDIERSVRVRSQRMLPQHSE